MPWKETCAMDQREQFIADWLARKDNLSRLCAVYGISRKTGTKWVQRFYEGGLPNLVDRSRRPYRIANRVSDETAKAIVELRKQHPLWGPKKLRAWLEHNRPGGSWPSTGTIGTLLKAQGLIPERRRRFRSPRSSEPFAAALEPNITWCTDFKGCFRVGRNYCHPLTISDACTRFLLCVQYLESEKTATVIPVYEQVFREYGLPLRMRSDNGTPFASRTVGGLSRLSVWWIKLGITPERIDPGSPQQNGRHERMHRTLKAETARPPRSCEEAQQAAFDYFRKSYNEERPHEALGNETPASLYVRSLRPFPDEVGDPEYPEDFEPRRLAKTGNLSFHSAGIVVSQVLANEVIGLEPVSDGRWQVWFGPVYLGLLSEQGWRRYEFLKTEQE